MAAVKAVRQAFETISLPAVIDLVPGGIDKGAYGRPACSPNKPCWTDYGRPGTTGWSHACFQLCTGTGMA